MLQVNDRVTQINLTHFIRDVPNFPKPGIIFKDITPLLANPEAFSDLIAKMAYEVRQLGAEKVIALESRGFIFGSAIAQVSNLPLVLARKAGKLPADTVSINYTLEYGEQKIELHKDSVRTGERIVVIDDLLATGGTACAASKLINQLKGRVVGYVFAIELGALGGRAVLGNEAVRSILKY